MITKAYDKGHVHKLMKILFMAFLHNFEITASKENTLKWFCYKNLTTSFLLICHGLGFVVQKKREKF